MDARHEARREAMRDAVQGFVEVAATLRGGEWTLATGCPGWSVRDIVAHVVGIEDVLTGGDEPDVEVPDLPHVDDDMARYLERHVEVRRKMSSDALLAELREVADRRLTQLGGDLTGMAPSFLGGEQPLVDTLGMRTFDIWMHGQDVRRAVGRAGQLDGPASSVCLRRMLRGLGATLPDRLDDATGTFQLTVTGSQEGTLALDLDSGDLLTSAPAATVAMVIDFADLVPLIAGRDDAEDPARVADVDGDQVLAARILTSLAITP